MIIPIPRIWPKRFSRMGGFEDLFSQFGFNRRASMQNKSIQIAHTIELLDVFRGKSVITQI